MECDIAMLTVEDEAFWGDLDAPPVQPVAFAGLPALQDQVCVVGFPIGGDTMSVSSGVVSRIEVTSYVHGASELLGVQIDAAVSACLPRTAPVQAVVLTRRLRRSTAATAAARRSTRTASASASRSRASSTTMQRTSATSSPLQ